MRIARLGDTAVGTCFCHETPISTKGRIISASIDTKSNGFGVARLGDQVFTDCGHYGTIITASVKNFVNGIGVARIGDTTTGCFVGTIITGSPDVDIG
jgi:uncharacterized Zn-binding protein involved in type VI secretion